MFTGLIEHLGKTTQIQMRSPGVRLVVDAGPVASDARIGDSVAVNGCCLTVVSIDGTMLAFDAGPETLKRTNLGRIDVGSAVNLERSLKVGERMGGHFVTGHIDATGTLSRRDDDEDWSTYWFQMPSAIARQMASKGSVAVDGVSLTLVEVTHDCFSVQLIPHTLKVTTLGSLKSGEDVNLETDLLAKYVQRQLSGGSNE